MSFGLKMSQEMVQRILGRGGVERRRIFWFRYYGGKLRQGVVVTHGCCLTGAAGEVEDRVRAGRIQRKERVFLGEKE